MSATSEPSWLLKELARRLLTSSGGRANAAEALHSIRRTRSTHAEAQAAIAVAAQHCASRDKAFLNPANQQPPLP